MISLAILSTVRVLMTGIPSTHPLVLLTYFQDYPTVFIFNFLSFLLYLYALALNHSTHAFFPVRMRWTQEEVRTGPHLWEALLNAGKIYDALNCCECLLDVDSKDRQMAFPRYGLSCDGAVGTCTYGP